MAKVESNLPKVIQNLKVARGQKEFVLNAAMREYATAVKEYVESQSPVDTGTYLAGWELENRDTLDWWLINEVDYSGYVHSQPSYGGPYPSEGGGVWILHVAEGRKLAEDNFEALLSDAIKRLLDLS